MPFKSKAKPHLGFALTLFSLVFASYLFAFIHYFQFPSVLSHPINFLASILYFDRFFVEYLSTLFVMALLMRGNMLVRALGYLVFISMSLISIVQLVSLQRGHQLLSTLAIENIGHISILLNPPTIIGGLVLFSLFGALISLVEKKRASEAWSWPRYAKVVFGLGAMALVFQQSRVWLPKTILDQREAYFMANNTVHTSPTLALHQVIYGESKLGSVLSEAEVLEARNFGIQIDLDKPYPFVSEQIYKGALPFPRKPGAIRRPNVIVFFTEGFSARTVGSYGSKYTDLTPHIDEFVDSSMRVDNYYNHTAATYRGILGQYCSTFPVHGSSENWDSKKDKYPINPKFCINKIFNRYGYKTFFFDSHLADAAYVDEMMVSLGVDEVLTAENMIGPYLNGAGALYDDALSDTQFMEGFIGWLKSKEKDQSGAEPFMTGLYNLGTHAWRDVAPDGIKYSHGQNTALNTVHNWDHAFGKFWQYFKSSPYFDNTIVILTADHTHYTESAFVEAMEGVYGFQLYFVDRIPFVVYDPTHELPKTFDANFSTSIDFAPSLAHLLEFPNSKNPFLGGSIFSNEKKVYEGLGLSSIGDDTYLVANDGVHHRIAKTRLMSKIDIAEKVLNFTKSIELSNRLWNSSWDDEESKSDDWEKFLAKKEQENHEAGH